MSTPTETSQFSNYSQELRRQREDNAHSLILFDYYPDDDEVDVEDDSEAREVTPSMTLDTNEEQTAYKRSTSFDYFQRLGILGCAVWLVTQSNYGNSFRAAKQGLVWKTCLRAPPFNQYSDENDKPLLNIDLAYLCYTNKYTYKNMIHALVCTGSVLVQLRGTESLHADAIPLVVDN